VSLSRGAIAKLTCSAGSSAPIVQSSSSRRSQTYGESKTFRTSAYPGNGVIALETFGSGIVVETLTLPSNGVWELDVDVTDLWHDAVVGGDDFFGIRIHDPVWTGTRIGAGTLIVDGIALEGVPERELAMLLGAGVLLLARLSPRRRRAWIRARPPSLPDSDFRPDSNWDSDSDSTSGRQRSLTEAPGR
jgi:hypothetical protein